MKQFILVIALFLSIAVNAFTPKAGGPVLTKFNMTYKNVESVRWTTLKNEHVVASFKYKGINTKVTLNKNGKIIQTMRYCNSVLPALVAQKLKTNYAEKNLYSVVEVINYHGTVYLINLKDRWNYYQIVADADGNMELKRSFQRGDI